MTQVKHFQETGYSDGRISEELYFEKQVQVRQLLTSNGGLPNGARTEFVPHLLDQYQRGCFVMDKKYLSSVEGATNFFDMLLVLGGPRLLPVRSSTCFS